MMDMNTYLSKVRGCWLGKNIGGTLGAPFESKRGVFDITYYTHDISKGVLPNDDLDLQLVWLNAAERYGTQVDAKILASYWQTFIVPHWSEYGAAKSNMRMGLMPPLSGWHHNPFRDSCGSFIRTEIWACLMPGNPQLAVKYAYEDAITDHSGEGVYGTAFCAAIQSAAFAENDIFKLIDIGLSYIPADCGVAKGVRTVLACYRRGDDWKACRKAVLNAVPGSFGSFIGYEDRPPEEDVPNGEDGYDAPSNIAIAILGLVYGEGNFDRTVCLAAGCGEDADCTTGTAGALYGIMYGDGFFDRKWTDPIGDEIKTVCVDITDDYAVQIPTTVKELTDRVARLMPTFMRGSISFADNGIVIHTADDPYNRTVDIRKLPGAYLELKYNFSFILSKQPHSVQYKFPLFNVDVYYEDGGVLPPMGSKTITLKFSKVLTRHQWITARWHLDAGVSVDVPGRSVFLVYIPDDEGYGARMSFTLTLDETAQPRTDSILELRTNISGEVMCIPITLICE